MATKKHDIRETLQTQLGDTLSFSVPESTLQSGEWEVNINELPDETLAELVRYGATRWMNDKLGGSKMTAEEKQEKFQKLTESLKSGNFSASKRGGGKRIDALEKAKREVYKSTLTDKFDYNATEASKLVKREGDRVAALKRAIADKLGDDLESDQVFEKLNAVVAKLDAHADSIKAQYEVPDIEI